MAPHQLFPFDEWGGLRASRHFLAGDASTVAQQDLRCPGDPSGAPAAASAGGPKSAFLQDANYLTREAAEESERLYPSDFDEALDDDDDEEVAAADADAAWPRHDFVPKRGVEIFVGGLTRSTRRDMLRDWFQHAGEVTEVRIARDKRRRRCRGYGYVRFATGEQANRAIETMHRFEFKHGRFLGVLPSDQNRTLFVGGLKEVWSCEYVFKLLKEKMPGLRKVEPIPDREDRFKIRTFCFLEFATHAEAAVIFNKHQMEPPLQQQQQQQQQTPLPPGRVYSGDGTAEAGELGADAVCEAAATLVERDARQGSSASSSSAASGGGGSSANPMTVSSRVDVVAVPSGAGGGALRFEAESLQGEVQADTGGARPAEERAPWTFDIKGGLGGEGDTMCGKGSVVGSMQEGVGEAVAAGWGQTAIERGARPGGAGGGGGAPRGGGVPLEVGGAVLKVDWADPLRYHIHLNGGIKGPSAPPEPGIPDGRHCLRGAGGERRMATGLGGVLGVIPGGVHAAGGGQQQQWHGSGPQQALMRHDAVEQRWPPEGDEVRQSRPAVREPHLQQRQQQQQQHRLYQSHHQQPQHRAEFVSIHHRHSRSPHLHDANDGAARERGYTIADTRSSSERGVGVVAAAAGSRMSTYYRDPSPSVQQQQEYGGRVRAISSSAAPPPRHHGYLRGRQHSEQDFGSARSQQQQQQHHPQPVHASFHPPPRHASERPSSAPGVEAHDYRSADFQQFHDRTQLQQQHDMSSKGHRGVGVGGGVGSRASGRPYSSSPEDSGSLHAFSSVPSGGGTGAGMLSRSGGGGGSPIPSRDEPAIGGGGVAAASSWDSPAPGARASWGARGATAENGVRSVMVQHHQQSPSWQDSADDGADAAFGRDSAEYRSAVYENQTGGGRSTFSGRQGSQLVQHQQQHEEQGWGDGGWGKDGLGRHFHHRARELPFTIRPEESGSIDGWTQLTGGGGDDRFAIFNHDHRAELHGTHPSSLSRQSDRLSPGIAMSFPPQQQYSLAGRHPAAAGRAPRTAAAGGGRSGRTSGSAFMDERGEPSPKPPPGFSLNALPGSASTPAEAVRRSGNLWHGGNGESSWQQQQQLGEGSCVGIGSQSAAAGGGDPSDVAAAGYPRRVWATPSHGEGFGADMRVSAGLWDAIGSGTIDCANRSSWPSTLLSPEGDDQPWVVS